MKLVQRQWIRARHVSRMSVYVRISTSAPRLDFWNTSDGVGIPTGFRNEAQGCEERAILGHRGEETSTPTGLRLFCKPGLAPQPRWGWDRWGIFFPR